MADQSGQSGETIGLVQIATLSGVSVATVSRALRGIPGVAAHTSRRVREAAVELGHPVSPIPAEVPSSTPTVRRTRSRTSPGSYSSAIGIAEVATAAGVSEATVSRALRGTAGVAAHTREAVQRAAADLGYVGSPIAAALARGRTNTIGVLAPWVTRWFFGAVIESFREAMAQHGYDILVYPVSLDPAPAFPANIPGLSKRVDGVLRVNIPLGIRPLNAHELQMPLVTIGLALDGVAGVQLDDVYVGYLATKHLLELGHRRIAFTGLDPDAVYGFKVAADRHRGYVQALSEAGVPIDPGLVRTTGFTVEAGSAALEGLLTDANVTAAGGPTAVVAVSDEVAMGVLYAARLRGIDVPRELSVVGVDDHELAYLFDLTTVGQPVREQGRDAAEMLLAMINAADRPEPVLRPAAAQLIVRNTTAPPLRRAMSAGHRFAGSRSAST